MFTCSPLEKIIVGFNKNDPFKSLHTLDSNTVLFSEWSSAVFISLVIVVHESLVCPEQFNCLLFFRKILQLTLILWFSSIFVYLSPSQQWLYDFEMHRFTPRTTEGLITTITEDSNTHWCSRRETMNDWEEGQPCICVSELDLVRWSSLEREEFYLLCVHWDDFSNHSKHYKEALVSSTVTPPPRDGASRALQDK